MVGQRDGAHRVALDSVDDVLDGRHAIQQRELAVDVQVHKVLRRSTRRLLFGRHGLVSCRRRLLGRLVRVGVDVAVFVPPGADVVERVNHTHG